MSFKLNGEKKNNIGNHKEHSTWFNTKSVIQGNNEYSFMKKSSLNLTSPIMMQSLDKYARKLPETTEEHTFGLNQKCPKQTKIEHYQEKCIKNNFIKPFNAENQTVMSIEDLCTLKFKPGYYNTSLLSLKLSPKIVLALMKYPCESQLMIVLESMYIESVHIHRQLNDLRDHEKIKQVSTQLKKYLFELFYQQFCQLCLNERSRSTMPYGQNLNRLVASLRKYAKNITLLWKTKLKKLLLNNGRLTMFTKVSHLVLCIRTLHYFFVNLLRKTSRRYLMRHRKQCLNNSNKKHSIKLYVKGTTKKKGFLDIVNEYKDIMNTDRLSFYQIVDVKQAYEGILEPSQQITKEELEICVNEN
ncbi:hypothetical protein QTP88_000890 [Uroleucon formosanum]